MSQYNKPPEPEYSAANTAQQSIAQSTALALSDATDNLRNINTLSTTAIGVALNQLLETGDPKYYNVIEQAQKLVANGADNFGIVGEKIATVLQDESNN
ncbi:hypothetical protein [Photobacterium chitinilyticum]|uniref:Uncharacterized protein n=1 Tax=Photobacterium chitinilyticum TaxID=2485123 RepID=A0A444JVI3_9GAMM|nr:hypothetical protein [Photobacterium chitinilyticum]RWX57063.1 hypothetical protein EDI28_03215 [Photobacterium chitinilyticum]